MPESSHGLPPRVTNPAAAHERNRVRDEPVRRGRDLPTQPGRSKAPVPGRVRDWLDQRASLPRAQRGPVARLLGNEVRRWRFVVGRSSRGRAGR
jgi:hypothetical protein